jgi:hypothetical protein
VELWLLQDGHDLMHTGATGEARTNSAAALLLFRAATSNRKKKLSTLIARAELNCDITAGSSRTLMSSDRFKEALARLRARELRTLQARAMAVVYEIKELHAQAQAVSGASKAGRALMRRKLARKGDLRAMLDSIEIWHCAGQDFTHQARAELHVNEDAAKLMLQSGEPPAAWDSATVMPVEHTSHLQLHWGKLYHRVASDIARCEEELINLVVEDNRLLRWVRDISSSVESTRQTLPGVPDVSLAELQASADAPCPYLQLGLMHARGELGVGAAVLLARYARRLNVMASRIEDGSGGADASDSDTDVGDSDGGAGAGDAAQAGGSGGAAAAAGRAAAITARAAPSPSGGAGAGDAAQAGGSGGAAAAAARAAAHTARAAPSPSAAASSSGAVAAAHMVAPAAHGYGGGGSGGCTDGDDDDDDDDDDGGRWQRIRRVRAENRHAPAPFDPKLDALSLETLAAQQRGDM